MALPIRDGNQSLTTLSTILVSNSHIPAHTVVSLGTQAITDIATAVSGVELGPNTLNALENITVTLGQVTITGGLTDTQLRASAVTISGVISGTVTANNSVLSDVLEYDGSNFFLSVGGRTAGGNTNFPINISGTVTIGSGTVTIGAGTAQIGSVTVGNSITIGASSVTFNSYVAKRDDGTWQPLSVETGSGYVSARVYPSDITPFRATVTIGNSVTIGSALPAGTNQIGSVTASGTVTANIGGIANSVTLPVRLFAEKYGESPSNQDTLVVCNSDGMLLVDARSSGTSVLGFDGNAFVQVKQVSGSSVTVGNTVTVSISGTPSVTFGTAVITGSTSIIGTPSITFGLISGTVTANPTGTQTIAGTVTANVFGKLFGTGASLAIPVEAYDDANSTYVVPTSIYNAVGAIQDLNPLSISGTVTANGGNFSSLDNGSPASKIQIGFSNLGGDFVAVNEDGYPFPVNLFVDGTRIASGNPLPISGTVTAVNHQGTAVTTSNFTSTTPSTILASANSGREVLTIFNEGAGNLHICAGATCTTIAYQVRLLAGDYYEVPINQTSLTHSAVFATTGTARVVQIS